MDKEQRIHQQAAATSASARCRFDNQVLRQQSQWLQTTLSDLDRKINAILSIIVQDDGDSFAKRAEMYYQKRPQLIEMVEDLHRSYRSLAEKYDQLRSELVNQDSQPKLLLPLSSSVNQVQGLQMISNVEEGKELNGKSNYSHSKSSSADEHDHEFDDYESSNGLVYEFPLPPAADSSKNNYSKNTKPDEINKQEKKNMHGGIGLIQRNTADDDAHAAILEHEKVWNELRFKVSELVEENLSHQAELIRRNDEKRETIRDLCSKMNMLEVEEDDENRYVNNKYSPVSHDNKALKKNQSQISRLKRLLGRFIKRNN